MLTTFISTIPDTLSMPFVADTRAVRIVRVKPHEFKMKNEEDVGPRCYDTTNTQLRAKNWLRCRISRIRPISGSEHHREPSGKALRIAPESFRSISQWHLSTIHLNSSEGATKKAFRPGILNCPE
jgi:hypothetical protein